MATSKNTECRAFGSVSNAHTTLLANTLRGLCTKYNKMHVYEVVLSVPGKNTRVKMLRKIKRDNAHKNPFQDKLPDRWCMVWESEANRGPAYRELPAAVREICESYCFCDNAPSFWQTLGARFEYDMVKDGNEYICHQDAFEIRVQLMRILSLSQPGNPESQTRNATDKYIIDVSTRVPEGKHVEGARALGAFGQTLRPYVILQRAEMPMA